MSASQRGRILLKRPMRVKPFLRLLFALFQTGNLR
jgi:hypothetical protein